MLKCVWFVLLESGALQPLPPTARLALFERRLAHLVRICVWLALLGSGALRRLPRNAQLEHFGCWRELQQLQTVKIVCLERLRLQRPGHLRAPYATQIFIAPQPSLKTSAPKIQFRKPEALPSWAAGARLALFASTPKKYRQW